VERLKHASLFTGIGGFDLAAIEAGFDNVFQVEIDDFCQKVLSKNFPNVTKYKDIRQFSATEYANKIEVLSGGFPCQDISISGKGVGIYGEKSGLWSEFNRVIKEIQPKYVIIENSPRLLRKGFEKVLYDLSESGYDAEWQCICASDYGYSHKRERLYIIAYSTSQRWKGILHLLKRSLVEKNKKANALDSQCHPFLQFEKRFCQSPVLGMDDGIPKKLDVVNRLGALGNAIVWEIALDIFKIIKQLEE
jgi:DNA (cytosine-5)-methyltransferase 1